MKVVKGSRWLKRNFLEQLKQLLEINRVVELDKLVNFDGKEQFVKNMLIRTELAIATNHDIKWQNEIELTRKAIALKNKKYQDKLKQEEKQLQEKMGL
jgi:hypothetical protein